MADHHDVLEDVRQGMIPAHIYNDKELFELEKERLFSRSWLFVAHESEVPEAGDYVVRRVLEDSFIISRDEKGEVRALFNMCLHRGMQVCRAEMGNAPTSVARTTAGLTAMTGASLACRFTRRHTAGRKASRRRARPCCQLPRWPRTTV